MSEADSDEENEEGDYTVYECPGLAPVRLKIIRLEGVIYLMKNSPNCFRKFLQLLIIHVFQVVR